MNIFLDNLVTGLYVNAINFFILFAFYFVQYKVRLNREYYGENAKMINLNLTKKDIQKQ